MAIIIERVGVGKAVPEGVSLPDASLVDASKALVRALKWKAMEVATTNPLSSRLLYKLGITGRGALPFPDCAFPVGHPQRVEGKII